VVGEVDGQGVASWWAAMKFKPGKDIDFQLEHILNAGLSLVDNLDGALLEITTTGSQQSVTHALGRTPIGFLVLFKDTECDIWGELLSSWTSEILYLNASVASVTVRLFVM
jgi:hypothetical protein